MFNRMLKEEKEGKVLLECHHPLIKTSENRHYRFGVGGIFYWLSLVHDNTVTACGVRDECLLSFAMSVLCGPARILTITHSVLNLQLASK